MKKYFLSIVALAGMLFATSCQESIVEPQLAGPTTFTVQLPDQMGTKALGSKDNVNQLFVAVYADASADNAVAIYRDVVSISGGQATVSLDLVQGQKYDLVFWAQVDNNYVSSAKSNEAYQFELVNIPMNKNYHNTDAGAAFFYYWDDFQPTGTSQPVTLRRPFAQLNLGTTEGSLTNNAGTFTLKSSVIKVKGIADNFNTVSGFGTVAEANKEKVYTFIAVENSTVSTSLPLDQTIKVADVDYKYVSMDYLPIVGDDQALVTVKAEITLDNNQVISHEFTNVPVRENYRTNIVGNLISSKTDFNIIVNDEWDGENVVNVASDTKAAQAMLDAATDGTTIQLLPGINYGTLYLRPVSGQQNTITDCDYLNYRNEMLREVENLTIIGAPGATVDAIKVVAGHIEGSTGYVVDIQNLVVDGVEFNDTYINPPHSYSAPLFFDLTYTNVNGLTVRNCKLIGNNANMNFVYFYGSGKPANSTFETAAKNITITDNTVDGIARLCELRQAENVTIKGNTIRNTALHGMLLAVDGGTYSGKVTITNNIAEGIHERFVRMAGAGAAEVVIKENIINNYLGTDADYIKVTDGSNVTIENNTLTSVGADDAESVQALLDNAKNGVTIQLQPGVNYGTLYMRPVAGGAQTKVVDWIGNNYRFETYSLFENITIVGAEGATVDAIKIEGGTYYNTEHSQAATYPVMLSLVELKNVVFDGVTFTGKGGYDPQGHGNAVNLSGSNIKVDGLTFKNCVLNNSENNARLLYKTESTTHVHNYSYDGQNYTFSPSLKDITITGCTFNGGYMGLELRETNNVTITNNVFNVADRNILLASNSGCTYSGNVTITGNVSNNAKERFVRMSGAGNAVVLIKDNNIYNYQGADADYIKVTDGTNVTIENNVLGRIVYGLTIIPNGENSKIIVKDKEGFLNLTKLFADWTALFSNGLGKDITNFFVENGGEGADYYYSNRWTISLEADIDLNNSTISPVILKHPGGTGAPTFDGKNHTIKNARIVTDATTENTAGLFDASNCNLKNLKLDNIHVTGSNKGNSNAGILSGFVSANVQNITIINSSVTGGKYTGGIIGSGYTDVTNCSLTNVTVKGGYKLGGVIGYICAESGTGDVTGNTLTDCTVDGIGGGIYAGGKSEYIIGKVVGNYNCNGTCNNNTITNMTTSAINNIGKIENGFTVVQ